MRGNNVRKLIAKPLMVSLAELSKEGVPITVLIKKNNLAICRPHLRKLINLYNEGCSPSYVLDNKLVHSSMFPPWLPEDAKDVMSTPDDWFYRGKFPYGEWLHR